MKKINKVAFKLKDKIYDRMAETMWKRFKNQKKDLIDKGLQEGYTIEELKERFMIAFNTKRNGGNL